jgi:hypothetical protein
MYGKVGDVSRCLYSDGGYLAKRITHLVSGERIEFEIIEQSIRYAARIVLKGGTIQIQSHEDGTSSVLMVTRYELHRAARWIPRVFIEHVVKAMHEIVIRDMQAQLAPRSRDAAQPSAAARYGDSAVT